MSGYTDEARSARRDADPATELLDKPFEARSLATKVRRALDR
jgi:hypothetical protein